MGGATRIKCRRLCLVFDTSLGKAGWPPEPCTARSGLRGGGGSSGSAGAVGPASMGASSRAAAAGPSAEAHRNGCGLPGLLVELGVEADDADDRGEGICALVSSSCLSSATKDGRALASAPGK